jgi:hypothetical protein
MSSVGTVHFVDYQNFTKKMARSYGTQKSCYSTPPIEIGGYQIGRAYGSKILRGSKNQKAFSKHIEKAGLLEQSGIKSVVYLTVKTKSLSLVAL